jgi:ectonucleotide pyrophosphatase/phosphodiesterase family protein 5
MYDPTLNANFTMQTVDSRWWQGEPVWNTAIKQNLRANVLFWPGSEVEVQGMRPSQWRPYDGSFTNAARIDTLLWWVGNRSCDLCVSYFDLVDTAGHAYGPGPNSTQLASALSTMDGLLNQLMQGLYTAGIQDDVTVLLVSDHGMSPINGTERAIYLDDYTDPSLFRLIDSGATLGIWPHDLSQTQSIYSQLYNKVPHLTVFDDDKKRDMHYTNNPRIPPIVGVAEDGWVVRTRARPYTGQGTHGYDPRLQSMGALFVGQGKGLKKGSVLSEVDNVNVYSLICYLLGIEPAKTSGSLDVWREVLV